MTCRARTAPAPRPVIDVSPELYARLRAASSPGGATLSEVLELAIGRALDDAEGAVLSMRDDDQ